MALVKKSEKFFVMQAKDTEFSSRKKGERRHAWKSLQGQSKNEN